MGDKFRLVPPMATAGPATGTPKIFRGLLTQAASAAPVVIVLENSIGNIVFTRADVGDYRATLTAAFTADKTMAFVGAGATFDSNAVIARTSANELTIFSSSGGTQADGVLSKTSIEIRVYS